VATPDNPALQHQHRANGNAAFRQTLFGFVNRGLQEGVHARIEAIALSDSKPTIPSKRDGSSVFSFQFSARGQAARAP
jgi:hypothetical protein